MSRILRLVLGAVLLAGLTGPVPGQAATPGVSITVSGLDAPGGLASPIQLVLLFTLITLAPAILMSMTCFPRILIVLHFLRQAIGTQSTPNNQIVIGLALFLSMFIMTPVAVPIWQEAVQPAMEGRLAYADAADQAAGHLRGYMIRYTREQDIALFLDIAKLPRPATIDEVPMRVMIPAYIISELKTGFQIGFVLFIPFLIIDIIIASILVSIGMFQLPPIIISTPFKLVLFVMVDGWNLVVGSLVKSFF